MGIAPDDTNFFVPNRVRQANERCMDIVAGANGDIARLRDDGVDCSRVDVAGAAGPGVSIVDVGLCFGDQCCGGQSVQIDGGVDVYHLCRRDFNFSSATAGVAWQRRAVWFSDGANSFANYSSWRGIECN